jgi:hypothetical protein
MYRYLIISFFIFCLAFKGSDSSKSTHTINWHESGIDLSFLNVQTRVLGFDGAVYPDQEPYFPVFVQLFQSGANEIYIFEVLNPVFRKWEGNPNLLLGEGLSESIHLQVYHKKSGDDNYTEISFIPLIKKNDQVFLLEKFELKKSVSVQPTSIAKGVNWKTTSVLAGDKWVKIKTSQKGIYKIPYEKLSTWGFSNPSLVNAYGYGGYQLPESLNVDPIDDLVKVRTWHGKDASGKDCLFFFSTGNVAWQWDFASRSFIHSTNVYTRESFYFLSQQGNSAHIVEKAAETATTPTHTVVAFDDFMRHESEIVNLIKSGKQWYGESFLRGTSRAVSIATPDPLAGTQAQILINTAGRSSGASFLDVTINGTKHTNIAFTPVNTGDETSLYADEKRRNYTAPIQNNRLDFSFSYAAGNNLSYAWLDYITVNWKRQLRFSGDELYFRSTENLGPLTISKYQIEGAVAGSRVFDITNPSSIFEVPATLQGSQLSFIRPGTSLREYVVFRPTGNFSEPDLVGEVPNQNLHGLDVPDFLVITHPDFIGASETIADFHRNYDGMSVEVVTTTQVYNEFGSGSPDATAIRNFIRMFYDRSKKIKYVMLVGDGSYDNRNILNGNRAFVPTFQSDNSLVPTSSFVSDDYFVILDQGESVYNGTVDLGIGRLPVSTRYEAEIVSRKILNYYSPEALGLWRNIVCFIGDDGDNGLHMSDSESLANMVNNNHREYQTEKIYFDAYPVSSTPAGKRYPGVTEAINKRVKEGVLVLNYVGHANDRFLSEERVLDVSIINSWTNINKLPIFVTATCEFSRFDTNDNSAGEFILLNPNGGGIGLFSTTRVVFAYSNFLLSQNFYRYVFGKDSNGENYRMGDVMRLAKINTINTLNKRNFTLLANPALRLSYPKYRVETNTVNGRSIENYTDTLSALSKVTIAGQITDNFGKKLSDFNGTITPVVYDKAQIMRTMGNSGQTQINYKVQNRVIYKGIASVTNGEFSFSFVIPKDISYNIGEGKILYYAENGTVDANGAFEGFRIGGSSASQVTDNKGPEVKLYMDDTSFKPGGETGQNPLLIAHIFDENGINTVGSGIGHDITAVLNDDYSQIYVLNDYYKAAKNDYTQGTLEFPFRNLPLGQHSLKLKVWDVANNSTEAEIAFVVTGDFYIESVANFPNPVSDYTYFSFTHNQPDATFDALIEIFDITGKRVDMLQITNTSGGKHSAPVRWDLGERGLRLRNGIYPYRITIRSGQGQLASHSGKMLLGR